MYCIRPVRADDLDSLMRLAKKAGDGLTTLPPDAPLLGQRIAASVKSFAAAISVPQDEYYFLMLEHVATGEVVGCSAVFSYAGGSQPFYNFATLTFSQVSATPAKRVDTKALVLANDFTGAAELATLFLDPDHRKEGIGRFLSRARYMLMATAPHRFGDKVMGELRGYADENGRRPLWEALGKHFFDMDFVEADRINGRGNSQFIADLMPKHPIYTCLLPQDAQEAIGRPHPSSAPAMRLLEKEGFRFRGAVDIFDGGPCLEVARDDIATIRNACRAKAVVQKDVDLAGQAMMIATPDFADFKVIYGRAMALEGGALAITPETARILNIKAGDDVIYSLDKLEGRA